LTGKRVDTDLEPASSACAAKGGRVRLARSDRRWSLIRRAAVAAGWCVLAFGVADAAAETRSLTFYNTHTGERSTVVFKRDGVYDQAGLKQLNFVLRDWRRNEQVRMDPELFDLVWEVYRDLGATQPINIICGYRAPETNAMLRNRSRGVAKHSQHMLGKALDFNIPGVDLTKLRLTGMKKQYGGVGIYYGSNFVHMDVGSVRTWPNRLSREQLIALFPDGRTLHLPSDGRPLAGYNLALADFSKAHPNRGRSGPSSDEDELDTPTPVPAVAVARAEPDTRPAPGPESRAGLDDPKLKLFAAAVPPAKPQQAAIASPLVAFAGLPRTKPADLAGAAPVPAPLITQAAAPVTAALAPRLDRGPRPSPSAADALAALAGDADDHAPVLAYAPPPAVRATGDRASLDRTAGEPIDAIASVGGRGVVLAALPPAAGTAPARRVDSRPASKADRGGALAPLVAPALDNPASRLFFAARIDRPGTDPLVRGAGDGFTAMLVRPQELVSAGFRGDEPRLQSGGFSGPAVLALAYRRVQ
jgi:uncharacterized protein YcbK (DUF882 family)